MAVEYDANGTPILTNDSLISDVPPYTQALSTSLGSISSVPVGCVMMWVNKAAAPDGWLPLDGSVTDLSPYPELAALFPSGLPVFGGRTVIAGTYNADPSKSNIGNQQDYYMAASQLATHQHDLNHTHITDVGRDHQGATTLVGSPHAVNGSFPITSRGPSQSLTNQSVYQNGTLLVDGANTGLTPLQTHFWVLYIIKHD